jgi:inner membrane protein
MEPVTHFLTGACLGRAGFNRKTAYATLTAVLAAEAADLDVLWGFAGPVEGLKHHRGITHTFWAVPVVAGVVVGAVWLFNRWSETRRRRRSDEAAQRGALDHTARASSAPPTPHQPIRWGWLYATAFVSASSHLLLDWSNNYGLRPFFPFIPHWYAGSFMFIAEPVLWALFLVALVMPWLLGLADREIGARQKPFRGRAWAIFALGGMVVLGCWRWAEHAQALAMLDNTQITPEPVTRIAAEPYMVNPFRWHAILETADFYQTAEIDTRADSIDSDPHRNLIYKPADTPAVEAAKRTLLGQVYLDWGTWAVARDMGPEPIPGPVPGLDPPQLAPNRQWTTVEFTDLRFDYAFIATRGAAARPPLAGWVYIVDGREDAGEVLSGRQQR